ncbi:hypothetical protein LTR85_009112 [Meristemomyces frigidus]|nr:hypothetical protein LTR85_009112 [Meristemomyces frigidus]
MDSDTFIAAIERQKKVLQAAKARKGQKPSNKPSRQQLELSLMQQKQQLQLRAQFADGHHMRQYFISQAYPPSTTLASALRPILISDLRLETHHRGKVLFVRTFGEPVRVSGLQIAVEDQDGDVDRLSVYNVDPLLEPEQLLPNEAVFAIKEPYYKTTADGGASIRVDHPSDLVHLQPLDPMVPDSLCPRFVELGKAAADWKKEGNASYVKKDYIAAVDADEQLLKCDLLRNRAIVNVWLKRYEVGMEDAKSANIAASADAKEKTAQLNGKAWYRAGRAAYELGRFQEAEDLFTSAQALMPEDADAVRELKRTGDRLSEMETGSYDFVRMSQSASKKHNRLDHASYTKNVGVRDAKHHGRGLFATADIKAGELILCKKAFRVAFDSDEGSQTYMIANLNTERGSIGTQATLLFTTVQKMLHNPGEAARFLGLHDGGYTPKCQAQVVDGLAVIDTFQTQAIMEHNCFGCPTVRSTSKDEAKQTSKEMAGFESRSFIGDMMMVRATKDIATGEEILMPYRALDTEKVLKQQWGFICDCAVCAAERKSSAGHRKKRAALAKEAAELLAKHDPSAQYQPNATTVAKAEKLAYDKQLFQNVPRTALVSLGLWLVKVRTYKPNPAVIIATAAGVLQDLGFSVAVTGQHVQFDRAHCLLDSAAIDAAMYAARAYSAQGELLLGGEFETFAKGLYQTLYGEMRGLRIGMWIVADRAVD